MHRISVELLEALGEFPLVLKSMPAQHPYARAVVEPVGSFASSDQPSDSRVFIGQRARGDQRSGGEDTLMLDR